MTGKTIKNMVEFSEASGISRPTVSKYLNDADSVRKSTRDRIEAAMEQFDYRPNFFAINHNRKSTKTIGIVVPYLADPFFAEMVRRLEIRVMDAGFWPIVFSAHGNRDLENNALATLQSLRPSGALVAPLGRSSDFETVNKFCREVPTVIFDSNVEAGAAFVGHNNRQSIDLIVNYLCRTGEPPCFFEMPPVNPNANKRRDAYTLSMEKLGHEPKIVRINGSGWDFEKIGMEEGLRVISERALPSDTILCSNDRLAFGLISAAYQKGLRVGSGAGCALRIAGQDNHPLSGFTCPSLTTVSQDYDSIAEQSVKLLFELVNGEEPKRERPINLFDGKLILRQSA